MEYKISKGYFSLLVSFMGIMLVLVYLACHMSFGPADRVLPGTYLLNVNLSNMSRDQAMRAIKHLEERLKQPMVLRYRESTWTLPLKRVGLSIDVSQEAQKAMNIGRTGPLWQRFIERRQAYKGIHLRPSIQIDEQQLEKTVNQTVEEIILPPRDAGLVIKDSNSVEISSGHAGRLVDMDQLKKDLLNSVLKDSNKTIDLNLVDIPPKYSTDEIKSMGVNTMLGMYSTKFDPEKANRSYNISVAAAALDGLTIAPQETISFNDVVGPRSTEGGYKNAPIIINNELVDGLGGGVCQVSTTLYNAVLLANLEVVERSNHSLPIPYVPIGRDATVVFDGIDFKFKNNTDFWVYIQSYILGDTLFVKIFGNDKFRKEVVVRSWVDETLKPDTVLEDDDSIPMGHQVVKQNGAPGYRASAERIVMENGRVIKTEKLPASVYKPINEIISRGTAPTASMFSTQTNIQR